MTKGERIKKLRKDKKLTLDDLAEQLNTTRQTIFKYESDIITNIPSDKIEMMAKIFNVSPAYIMGWEESEKPVDSQWGNDAANREYLKDKPELLEIYDQIVNRDDMVILFDKTKDLEPKDVESVLLFVQTIRKQRGLDD